MTALEPRPSFLRASANDAACAQMRKAGRAAWNEDDRDVATETLERLIRSCYGTEHDHNNPDACFLRFQIAEQMERRGQFRPELIGELLEAA